MSARISSAKKERETWSISTPAFVPNRKPTFGGAKKSEIDDDSIVQRRGDAPSTPLVASSSKALCALLFAARARSFFFFLFSFFSLSFSAGCCCWSLMKASSFFLNRRVSFKCVKCGRFRRRRRRRRRRFRHHFLLLPSFFCAFRAFCVRFGETTVRWLCYPKKKRQKKTVSLHVVVVVGLMEHLKGKTQLKLSS